MHIRQTIVNSSREVDTNMESLNNSVIKTSDYLSFELQNQSLRP